MLRYHILQDRVELAGLRLGKPVLAPTLLLNDSWTNVTGGQRVMLIKQTEDEVIVVTGKDSRSVVDREDIQFHGGLIHVVDTVLVPPYQLAPTCQIWFKELEAFLGALYQTGLYDEASTAENVTIFAPQNSAFQLTFGALASLSLEDLRKVLAYHIVPDSLLYSTNLRNATQWPTLATTDDVTGLPINITV